MEKNKKTALILASIAVVFFLGFVIRRAILQGYV
jgi:hypothetical protein